MKTLTEFSGVVLRQAADARARVVATGVEGDALAEALATDLGIAADRAARLLEAIETAGAKLDSVRLIRVYQGETAPPKARTVGEYHYLIDLVAVAPARGRGGRPGRDRGGPGGLGGRGRSPRGDGPPRGGREREERGDDRPGRGEKMPTVGAGWMVTRAPRDARDDDGRPRKGPRKGGRPGGKPGDGRGDRKPRRAGGPGPHGGRGPRPPATEAGAPVQAPDAVPGGQAPAPMRPGARPARAGSRREPPMPVVEERKGIARPDGEAKKKRRRRRGKKKPGDAVAPAATGAPEIEVESPTDEGAEPARPNRRIVRPAEPSAADNGEPAPEPSSEPVAPISPPPTSVHADTNEPGDNG